MTRRSTALFLFLGCAGSGAAFAQANRPPVALADSYTTPLGNNLSEDAPGVLANDSDPDGDALSAVLVSSSGASGLLFLYPDGSFEYEPATTGTDVFLYAASDGLLQSDPASVTFTVTAGGGATPFFDEASYLAALGTLGFDSPTVEGFEDPAKWGGTRTPSSRSSVTSGGITWTSNRATSNLSTSGGAAFVGAWGFYSNPHGNYSSDPSCLVPGVCTDGWKGHSAGLLVGIGGYVRTAGNGGALNIYLDEDEANPIEMGQVAPGFYGVIDPRGFHTFEYRETEGTSGDAFLLFGDQFTFAALPARGPLARLPSSSVTPAGAPAPGAAAERREGSVPGATRLTSAELPLVGRTWRAQVDRQAVAEASGSLLFAASAPASGVFLEAGELLVDVLHAGVLFTSAGTGGDGVDRFAIRIPDEPALRGARLCVQALTFGRRPRLSNALDLVVGAEGGPQRRRVSSR